MRRKKIYIAIRAPRRDAAVRMAARKSGMRHGISRSCTDGRRTIHLYLLR
jgi:hypothetical protein